eukprot:scaffold1354_cov111-Isochrysis_galbana.AAC.2
MSNSNASTADFGIGARAPPLATAIRISRCSEVPYSCGWGAGLRASVSSRSRMTRETRSPSSRAAWSFARANPARARSVYLSFSTSPSLDRGSASSSSRVSAIPSRPSSVRKRSLCSPTNLASWAASVCPHAGGLGASRADRSRCPWGLLAQEARACSGPSPAALPPFAQLARLAAAKLSRGEPSSSSMSYSPGSNAAVAAAACAAAASAAAAAEPRGMPVMGHGGVRWLAARTAQVAALAAAFIASVAAIICSISCLLIDAGMGSWFAASACTRAEGGRCDG